MDLSTGILVCWLLFCVVALIRNQVVYVCHMKAIEIIHAEYQTDWRKLADRFEKESYEIHMLQVWKWTTYQFFPWLKGK